MSNTWPHEFQERMRRFKSRRENLPGETAVSIKIRVSSGCFHREHSPHAYELIDQHMQKLPTADSMVSFEEHESGPEILAYVMFASAALNITSAVINFVTAIIKARSEGIKKGDHPSDPLQLIVRLFHDRDGVREEKVLTIGHTEHISDAKLQAELISALGKLLEDHETSALNPSRPRTAPQLQPHPASKKGKALAEQIRKAQKKKKPGDR